MGEECGKSDEQSKQIKYQTPMQDVNEALKECGFGWFHIRVLIASYFAISASVFITNTTPYILPNAECDLDMSLVKKGFLTATPYLGMILSSIAAGFLVDTFGRKLFLVGGYALLAFFTLISSMSQSYYMLITSKFCEGFVFAAAFSPTMTYTSEFCHGKISDRVVLLQSSFRSINQISLALLSWKILVNEWYFSFFGGYFVLNTWNFYLLFMVFFSSTSCILYTFLPESPKYLVTKNKFEEARKILCYIYKLNTGKPAETFKYANIWKDKIDEEFKHPDISISLRQQLTSGLKSVKPLFHKQYLRYLLLLSSMIFFIMVLYNVLRMWYPQLSTVVEHYATEENQELCIMLDTYTNDLRLRSLNATKTKEVCVPVKSGAETYTNNIIIACTCIPSYFLTGLLVNKVGKKYLLLIAGLLSVGITLGLRWSKSKVQVVAFVAMDMTLGQIMTCLVQANTMEFFPTEIRTLALAVIMTMGRIGSLVGNVLFPVLLDMGCMIPFYSIAGFMTFVTLLAAFLPNKEKLVK